MALALAATVALGGALSACETRPPTSRWRPDSPQSGGYSEIKLEDNRWRVTFQATA